MADDIPRRIRIDQQTPAEAAIRAAVEAVEAMPADVRLTDAVVLLGTARESVADYVDGIDNRRQPREPHAALVKELEWCRDNGNHGPRTEKAIIAALAALITKGDQT